MSSTLPQAAAAAVPPLAPSSGPSSGPTPGPTSGPTLEDLRAELDRLDDAVHDLLMQRAEVVQQVASFANKGPVKLRPGREAAIIRRLLARHAGPLPPRAVVRLWRELLAATTSMQGAYAIAVCEQDAADGLATLAREHFGALTPLHLHGSPAQALADLGSGAATVAVVPVPAEEDSPRTAWWTFLMHGEGPRLHVVARLPFWAPRPEGVPRVQAMVVANIVPDASGLDRTLLGLELPPDMSRARLTAALTAAGFEPGQIIIRRDPHSEALVDLAGLVAEDDPRLDALPELPRRPVVVGGYAVPVEDAP